MSLVSEELRRRIAADGRSLRAIARQVPCDAGWLSKVASGKERCSPRLAARLDQLLGTGDVLSALVTSDTRMRQNPDETERLEQATVSPRRVDGAVVSSLATMLAEQRRIEDIVGAASVLRPVRVQLDVVREMVQNARVHVRPLMLEQAAEWSQYTGWLESTNGDRKAAAAHFAAALEAAEEVGNRDMVASLLSWRGHLAWVQGQIPAMVGLSAASQRDEGVAVAVRAFSNFQQARGLAILGEARSAESALAQGTELAQQVLEEPETTPRWCYYYAAPGFFDMQRGMILRRMGRNLRAAAAFADGLAALPKEMKDSDWAGYYLYEQARAYISGGNPDEGCACAVAALRIAKLTGAARLQGQLKVLRTEMSTLWPGRSDVAALDTALAGS